MTEPSPLERTTGATPTHSIIWLHGLGADGRDFEPLVPELAAPDWPALRFVFPDAPVRPVTVNGGAPMRAWYDIASFDIAAQEDADGIHASIKAVDALIAREGERGILPVRIFIAGFSQGGAIALAAGLRHTERLAGIIALSTYLPLAATTAAEASAANAATAIFQAHGQFDPVVPPALGIRSRDALRTLGHDVAWHAYPMAHQVCAEEIADLRDWFGGRLRT